MKNSKITLAILSGLLAFAIHGYSQTAYELKINGSCETTNDSGDIVSTKISTQTFIQDAITATGTTNGASSLVLVYVQSASSDPITAGDFIEVVDKSTGTAVYTNLLFLYGGSFPQPLINGAGDQLVAGAGVVPLPLGGSGDSLGGATINARILKKKTVISGSFNYISLRSPGATFNDTERVCSGSFSVGKPFAPK